MNMLPLCDDDCGDAGDPTLLVRRFGWLAELVGNPRQGSTGSGAVR